MTVFANPICFEFYVKPSPLAPRASLHLFFRKLYIKPMFDSDILGRKRTGLEVAGKDRGGLRQKRVAVDLCGDGRLRLAGSVAGLAGSVDDLEDEAGGTKNALFEDDLEDEAGRTKNALFENDLEDEAGGTKNALFEDDLEDEREL